MTRQHVSYNVMALLVGPESVGLDWMKLRRSVGGARRKMKRHYEATWQLRDLGLVGAV